MPVNLTWQHIALRILLALAASFLIGYDRDEHGKSFGIRTCMLVCLAATLAMIQANALLATAGKPPTSFVELDLMRLPLGILSGIGFIGAGAILRRDGLVHGLTTAATLWFVTILGLLFGGGQIALGITGTILVCLILSALKHFEKRLPTRRTATLCIELVENPNLTEDEIRTTLHRAGFSISTWSTSYTGPALRTLDCELHWPTQSGAEPDTPEAIRKLASSVPITKLTWKT
ncbi:MgtC/SapB family protein [Granulicella sp. dw_53]|uniref:MgtC/SapB family protein n=1 Tax=Granulicella sp. dw_53 TaxID=2719792 RepID=UPI001BD30919|nr:MgtC/SapB family protein [Granulicella sp. dw_53]